MIAKWIVLALIAYGAVMTIANVGKPRKPITAATAAVATVLDALIIAAIVIWWQS